MDGNGILETVRALGRELLARGWRLATAESCTGGLVGHCITSVAGASDWYLGGVVAYDEAVKERLLGVPAATLAAHGAVSRETARAMAAGALRLLDAKVAVAVTGVAGPGGGTPQNPVGTVFVAWAWPGGERQERLSLPGERAAVREQAACAALRGLLDAVRAAPLSEPLSELS